MKLFLHKHIKLFSSKEQKIPELKDPGYWHDKGFEKTGNHEAQRLQALIQDLGSEKIKSDIQILDVGCGKGRLPQGILRSLTKFQGLHYTGIDVNKKNIKYCTKKFLNHETFCFSHFDMQNSFYNPSGKKIKALPFKDGTLDIIYCWSVFSHLILQDVKFYFQEFFRTLKDTGVIFLTAHARAEVKKTYEINPSWYTLAGKVPISKNDTLIAVCYHPVFFSQLIKDHNFNIKYKVQPIYASNYQTGYYLTK